MTRTKRGCLAVLAGAALLVAVLVVGVVVFLPGDLEFGGRAPVPVSERTPAAAPVTVDAPGLAGTVPAAVPASAAWVTYLIPNDILQAELRKAFPIRQNVVDLIKLQLDEPTFIDEPDGAFLRVRLEVEARVLEGGQRLPGVATVRTQLAYDPDARQVALRNTQLVDLVFTGSGASVAGALQPVLAQGLAVEMEGYVIFKVPADGLGWLKNGYSLVRDVYVKDGRVAVAIGP